MEGIGMTTVYVAAEKLMSWNPDGRMFIHEDLVSTINTHCNNNRFVVYFAPLRFGLLFDSHDEVEEAWQYIENALHAVGFVPDDCILFDEDAKPEPFLKDLAENVHHETALIFSNSEEDEKLSQETGVRRVTEIPAGISNIWHRISISRALRSIAAAAIHT